MSSEPSCKNGILNRFYIAISRDGKYSATFDAATRHVKILKTIDYNREQNNIIAHFKIKDDDLSIQEFYDNPPPSQNLNVIVKDRWSIDISNDGNFIFIAASRILDQNMEIENEISTMVAKNFESNKECCINFSSENATDFKTVICCLKLNEDDVNKVDFIKYNYNRLSGICRFAEEAKKETKKEVKSFTNRLSRICSLEEDVNSDLEKFILLNYNGIYSFKYNLKHTTFSEVEKFNYPDEFKEQLENLKKNIQDRTSLLLSHIYKKYFIIKDNKNSSKNFQDNSRLQDNSKKVLEGKMRLETSIKIGDDDTNLDDIVYSIDKQELQFCIATGSQSIGIFLMEHGSRIASKSFEKFNIRKIHLIEFINNDEKLILIVSDSINDLKIIIWDIYDTDKVEMIPLTAQNAQNSSTCFASSSGNILHINNEGKVISISKMVADKSIEKNIENLDLEEFIIKLEKQNHTIYFHEKEKEHDEFEPAVSVPEPWITK
ncbi:13765_t:CDS:2, partial [Funneliformis geosporum]